MWFRESLSQTGTTRHVFTQGRKKVQNMAAIAPDSREEAGKESTLAVVAIVLPKDNKSFA